MTPDFIPGLQLSEAFYRETVRPLLDVHFPGLPHSAALVGYGSDVLGFDTPVSTDHWWGPRMLIFLNEDGFEGLQPQVHEMLRQNLPVRFRGYSVHYGDPIPEDNGVRKSEAVESGPVNHLVRVETLRQFWGYTLGVDPFKTPTPVDWMTFQEHQLLSTVGGGVFHDEVGLNAARERFAYYPHDVWLYVIAAQWRLIAQEEAFVGRTVSVGDELGSRVLTGRIVERLMHLAFLFEKSYAPYSKWFGTAFQQLDCYPRLGPLLDGAIAAESYPKREWFLAQAYTLAVEMQNALGIIPPLASATRTYSGWHLLRDGVTDIALNDPRNTRPHQVIFADRLADALCAAITDPEVLSLLPLVGSVNQFLVHSSDALQNVAFCRSLAPLLRKERAA
jgi:hypothetical protein